MIFPFKRKREKENLINTPVYVNDTSLDSSRYFVINSYPTEFTSGKNAIRLLGSRNLVPGSEILAEVLDNAGNPIYSEVNNYRDQHNNFIISVLVYDDTASGIGSITLLGKALTDQKGLPIPKEWQNKYNIKWTQQITISPTKRNDSEILIDKPPLATIQLLTIPYYETVPTTSSLAYTVTEEHTQFVFQGLSFVGGDSSEYTYDIPTQKDIYNPREGFNRVNLTTTLSPVSKTTNTVDGTINKKIKDIFNGQQIQDLATYNNVIYIPTNSINLLLDGLGTEISYSGGFTDDMIGAKFQSVYFGTRLPQTSSTYTTASTSDNYTATIIDIIDSNRAILSKPYTAEYATTTPAGVYSLVKHRYKQFSDTTASVIYKTPPTYVSSDLISQSLLYFTINDLSPLSGDIYRIKTYQKESGRIGEYQIISDDKVGATEILVDNNVFNDKPYVDSQFKWYGRMVLDNVEDYWNVLADPGSGTPTQVITGLQNYTSSVPQLNSFVLDKEKYEDLNSVSIDSLLLSGDSLEFFKVNQTYRLTFKVIADFETGATPVSNCELEVYASSEDLLGGGLSPVLIKAFDPTQNLDKATQRGLLSRYGKLLGNIKSSKGVDRFKPYSRVSFEFQADADGVGRILFRVKNGAFHISEVHVTPAVYNGFTPNYITYTVPLTVGDDTSWGITSLSQSLDFKIEYFDYLGRQSDYITYLPNIRISELLSLPTLGCNVDVITQAGVWPPNTPAGFGTDYRLKMFHNFERTTGSGFNIFGPPPSAKFYPGGYPDDGINALTSGINLYYGGIYPQYFGWNYMRYSGSRYSGSFGFIDTNQAFGGTGTLEGGKLAPFTSNFNHSSSWAEGIHSSSLNQCACIAKPWASESWRRFNNLMSSGSFNQTTANTYLKQTRLYWPATTGSTTAAANQYTPFEDGNGNIYKVKFKIVQPINQGNTPVGSHASKYGVGEFQPDEVGGVMNIYIYDVGSGELGTPTTNSFAPGIASWYPPSSNIAQVTYADLTGLPLTSSYLQKEVLLVQWGNKGRLVFEASGSSNGFFGGCIDDVEVCLIGKTTNPQLIAPPGYTYFISASLSNLTIQRPQTSLPVVGGRNDRRENIK